MVPASKILRAAPSSSQLSLPLVSALSVLSPSPLPLVSHTPSSGSGITNPPPWEPAVEPEVRPTHPLRWSTYCQPQNASPLSTATVCPTLSACCAPVVAALTLVVTPPVVAPLVVMGPPSPEPSHSIKRKTSGEEPMSYFPLSWHACAPCKRCKHKCWPPKGSKPPFTKCTACHHDGLKCTPTKAEEPVVAGAFFLHFLVS